MRTIIGDALAAMEFWANPPAKFVTQYQTSGLKFFNRPHDLCAIVDKETGKVKGCVITTVYTPFSKDDIEVKTKVDDKGARLTLALHKSEKSEYTTDKLDVDLEKNSVICDYCGISKKNLYYEFAINTSVFNIKGITVKAEDGILSIIIPVIESPTNETVIPVK
jgi:hypothetical protein